uniref:RING-type E3 ubiquitin transferase n=1 Tax=Clastoptera arizonana TaxID=38151 RepID=A0A1B6CG73_9HEMI
MYIQVKSIDGRTEMISDISKTCRIPDLKLKIESFFNIKPDKQRLFYKGKQLEGNYTLFDYNIKLNDVIQLMEKPDLSFLDKKVEENQNVVQQNKISVAQSLHFKVADPVDYKDEASGAWCEGKIKSIFEDETILEDSEEKYSYNVECIRDTAIYPDLSIKQIRPIACTTLDFKSLKIGDIVMANYNVEDPLKRGYWYDFKITKISDKRRRFLIGDIMVSDTAILVDREVIFVDEVMQIEKNKNISERSESAIVTPPLRKVWENDLCNACRARPDRKCKECGCHECGLKSDPEKQVMCDECDNAFHIWCTKPKLDKIPDDDYWFCHSCKVDENEIVKAGEKLKYSKRMNKMPSMKKEGGRDWGKGMACMGLNNKCTIVPIDHFGPIPGIEVGTQWKYRQQVNESGVHRSQVAGIHGREKQGAFSIVLSGGYEDDIDNGDEFFYTGSGGRDLSGNKRTATQSCDQKLTRMNKALALNCNAPFNDTNGAEAKDWKKGKPVRVVRNYKLLKHSKYAPQEGNRYDGIYKLVKYYPQRGKAGFLIWRYMFRRDDPAPAPWTKEGKRRTEALGLEMIYPENYLKSIENKVNKSPGSKRQLSLDSINQSSTKKLKIEKYKLPDEIKKFIAKDKVNTKVWTDCEKYLVEGKPKYVAAVKEAFECICCLDLVFKPVTLDCTHTVCYACVRRSFKSDIKTCPHCRKVIEDYNKPNENLQEALILLFPGYTSGRKV